MAVTLDFQIDENVLAEDRQHDPAAADPAIIETTYFVMPVRFSTDGKEVLQTQRSEWLPQPVIGFTTHLALAVCELGSTGVATCFVDDGGTLRFERRGTRVHLTCSFNGVAAEIPIQELEGAVTHFRARVRDSFRALIPELTTHPSWSTWFPVA